MGNIIIFIIAISLSMDAFSLSLAYGTQNLSKKNTLELSFVVGVYHFFMPIFGMVLGMTVVHILPISPDLLVCIILAVIGLQMIVETFKNDGLSPIVTFGQLLIFGLAVSIDSFSVGIGLQAISENYLFCSSIFSLTSFAFTYLGLVLGRRLNQILGRLSTLVGGSALIIIGIIYLIT